MSRLLHAAARGARIEAEWKGVWSGVAGIHFVPEFNYRIHPDDEHLQYGPISTALRDMAEDDGTWRTDLRWNIAHTVANEFNDYYDWRWCEPDYPLFYLILAEALADEGM
jgi:hypothetical protein